MQAHMYEYDIRSSTMITKLVEILLKIKYKNEILTALISHIETLLSAEQLTKLFKYGRKVTEFTESE